MAVTRFNAGACATSERMRSLGIEPTEAQIACMKADEKRIGKAEKACEDRAREVRRQRQVASRRARADLEALEGLQYAAGEF